MRGVRAAHRDAHRGLARQGRSDHILLQVAHALGGPRTEVVRGPKLRRADPSGLVRRERVLPHRDPSRAFFPLGRSGVSSVMGALTRPYP